MDTGRGGIMATFAHHTGGIRCMRQANHSFPRDASSIYLMQWLAQYKAVQKYRLTDWMTRRLMIFQELRRVVAMTPFFLQLIGNLNDWITLMLFQACPSETRKYSRERFFIFSSLAFCPSIRSYTFETTSYICTVLSFGFNEHCWWGSQELDSVL